MHARIFKKRAPSRKFFASVLSIMVSFAVSSALSCMEVVVDVTEKKPLIQNESSLEQDDNNDERIQIDPLPEVPYDPGLLIEFDDPETPAQEMDKISIYLQYMEARYIKPNGETIHQIREYGKQRRIFKEKPEEFEKVLLKEALEVDSQQIIPNYLRKVYEKGVGNQKLNRKLLEQRNLAKEHFKVLLEEYNKQKSEPREHRDEINKHSCFYAIAIPVLAFSLGMALGVTIMQWWRCSE